MHWSSLTCPYTDSAEQADADRVGRRKDLADERGQLGTDDLAMPSEYDSESLPAFATSAAPSYQAPSGRPASGTRRPVVSSKPESSARRRDLRVSDTEKRPPDWVDHRACKQDVGALAVADHGKSTDAT